MQYNDPPSPARDKIRKSPQNGPTNFSVNCGIYSRGGYQPIEKAVDRLPEFRAQTWPLLLVPVLGLLQVLFGEATNNDLVHQRSRSLCFTSSQDDSAPGKKGATSSIFGDFNDDRRSDPPAPACRLPPAACRLRSIRLSLSIGQAPF